MYKRYSPIPMNAKVIEVGGVFYLGSASKKRKVYLFKNEDDARKFADTREWPDNSWFNKAFLENYIPPAKPGNSTLIRFTRRF